MDKYTLKDYYTWSLEGDKVFVLDEDNKIAGIVDLIDKGEYVLIDMLAKNILVKSEKVGSRLLEFSEDYSLKLGKNMIMIEALDTASNFYRKFDYIAKEKRFDKEWGILTIMIKYIDALNYANNKIAIQSSKI
ncbi:GNAT family N-acetyltransferase [Acidianus brierleyi]|uniref:N-acetyltransferase domain-containing protein n=1 Tax=Acidianus brierleyi TaxID=41673 RepID=A0A2U9IHA6_9CREN|nr:GNAT family N-acetyltransferase [Acidianus brierleyi]AWR95366.1 GNAT family N-acetyltransferase [Acidianus brierleyi]